jgi:probable HAF family extracellular repeat protein
MKTKFIIASTVMTFSLAVIGARADVTATPVGTGIFPNTDRTVGYAVSDDGNIVSGISVVGPTARGFRWTRSGGLQDIGTLGGDSTTVRTATPDGSVLVGISRLTNNPSGNPSHAFRWTSSTGMQDLGTLGGTMSDAEGISANGLFIVGSAMTTANAADHAFVWTQASGMRDLGTLGGTHSGAVGVSADGSIIVGSSTLTGNTAGHAVRWINGVIQDLGSLGGSNSYSSGVSADGSVIAGVSALTGDTVYHPFVWSNNVMTDIGTLGGSYAYASGISADGSIVVGYSDLSGGGYPHIFRWTRETGIQDLVTLMSDAGVDLTGYDLAIANAVSSNGKYITGEALFPDGTDEAFVACYDPSGSCVGVTTPASQAASVQTLAADQRAVLVESRATANRLLGTLRPIDDTSYVFGGYLFDGGTGYAGGQYAAHGLTILGGIAYGSQDYPHISQKSAFTLAAALRYAFADLLDARTVYPYVEAGGWGTPNTKLGVTRTYANGSGSGTGQGNMRSALWAGYVRAGLVWEESPHDQFVGFTEWGQQYLGFDSYSEAQARENPFSAQIDGGLLRMNVVRSGALWTHRFETLVGFHQPTSITFTGAVATSFAVHAGLNAVIAGVGAEAAANRGETWGEFGARVETRLTEHLALGFDVDGTTGGGEIGTTVHGSVGLTYKF